MKSTEKEDHLTAALALSADEKVPVTGCIKAESFALLLESKLPDADQRLCMEHLSQCDSCYREWKLMKGIPASGRRKNVIPLIKARSYRYIGSTLAVAATVAVFLNIYQLPTTEMAPTDKDKAIVKGQILSESETVMDSVEEPSSASFEQRIEEKAASPKALKYMQKSKTRGKAEHKDKEALAPAPAIENTMSKPQSATVKRSLRSKTLGQEVRPGEHGFFDMVKKGCAQNEYNEDYWISVEAMGKTLNGNESFELYSREKIVRLRKLISAMEDESWQHQCDEILGLLAEEQKSR